MWRTGGREGGRAGSRINASYARSRLGDPYMSVGIGRFGEVGAAKDEMDDCGASAEELGIVVAAAGEGMAGCDARCMLLCCSALPMGDGRGGGRRVPGLRVLIDAWAERWW